MAKVGAKPLGPQIAEESEVEVVEKEAKELGGRNIAFFAKYYLARTHPDEYGEFHKSLFKAYFTQDKNVVIAAPRYHGKSTLFSFDLPIWAGCYGVVKNVLIISATATLASLWIRRIKAEFEGNESLIAAFGDLKSDKWSEDLIVLGNGVSIEGKGRGQQIRGYHYDLVICDDLEDDELVRSEIGREQFKEWFDRALYNTLGADDRLFYIGTILSPNCFLKELMTKPNWTKYYYQAYVGGVEKPGNELWAAKWNHAALQDKKVNSPYAFAVEFMNNPLLDSNKRFQHEWLKFYDTAPGNIRVITTIDPAMSMDRRADFSAIVTCGITSDGSIYVLDVSRGQWNPYTLCEEIFRIHKMFAPFKIGIETVIFQKMFKIFMQEKARERNIYLPIVELKTSTNTTKEMRILGLVPYFAEGKVYLKRGMYALLEELNTFPMCANDDCIDALSYQPQLFLKPGGMAETQLTYEEQLKKLNEMAIINLFKPDKAVSKSGSPTGYRSHFYVGN